jgi:hypothetical protein
VVSRVTWHIAVFELSYLERYGWSGVAHFWLENGDGSQVERVFAVNASIDQTAISLGMATLES